MGKKVRINLSVNEEVIEKAKEIGLNISKVCENALIRSINALESSFSEIELNPQTQTNTPPHLEKDGGQSRDRTCDHRHVKAMSYH